MKEKVNYIINHWQNNRIGMLKFVYIICLLAALCFNGLFGVINGIGIASGKYPEQHLTLGDFTIIDGEIIDEMTLDNMSNDTQLIYNGPIRNLYIKCTFSENPGEFITFYNQKGNDVFGTHKMKYTRIYDGWYTFDFPLGTKQIRVDTGIFETTNVFFEDIFINKPTPRSVFGVSTAEAFYLLIVPVILFLLIDTVIILIVSFNRKRV